MINVKDVSYTVIILTEKKLQLNITNAVQSLGWEENENELSQKITFEAYNAKYNGSYLSTLMKIGCIVAVKAKAGGKNSVVAYGKVVEAEASNVSGKPIYKVTAYDCLFDLQKSQDNVYYASGKTTRSLLEGILKSWGVSIGSDTGPNVTHGKVLYKNKGLDDICRGILDEAKKKNGGKGMIRSSMGKVDIITVGSNKDVYVFTNKNTTTSKYKISTVDMITRVKIVGSSDDDEAAKVEATVDGKTSYGIRQKIITNSKSENLSDAKKEAKEMLEENGDPKDTRTIVSPDVPFIRKGDAICLDVTLQKGNYIVTSIQHNADKGTMTMQVEKYTAPSTETQSAAKYSTYKVIANSGLNMRDSPNGTILATAPYGTIVQCDGTSNGGWLHCLYNGQWGWMYSQYLQLQSSGSSSGSSGTSYKVTARSGLNMRKTPNGTIITAAPYGTTVTSDGQTQSGWIHCKYGSTWGWMYSQYLQKS